MGTSDNKKVILKTSMNTENGQLFQLEDESVIALKNIAKLFVKGRIYTEKETNKILQEVYDDYVTLRRFLIEYGLMDRKPDGSQYWLREK